MSLPRKSLRDYTFPDGTTIPAGTMIAAAATATQLDEEFYDRPEEFDGFRFSKLREAAAEAESNLGEEETESGQEEQWRYRLTGTGLGYLAFGGGRHVWYVFRYVFSLFSFA